MKPKRPAITFKSMVLQNVNQWRRKNNLPPAGHESSKEFKAHFNNVGLKVEQQSVRARV